MKKLMMVTGVLVSVLAFSSAAQADGNGMVFWGALSGEQEIPQVLTDTTGSARVAFDVSFTSARFRVRLRNGVAITQAHLHCARAGENGPVVAFLFNVAPVPGPGGIDVNGLLARGELTNYDILPIGSEDLICGITINNLVSLAAAIDAGRIYVNVHSEIDPSGVVRGQLFPDDSD